MESLEHPTMSLTNQAQTGMTSYQFEYILTLFKNKRHLLIEKPLKPAEFAEKKLLEAILDETYKPGNALPAERVLSGLLGVTRPTLRETLQRMSKEGWITIAHGKPTRVNDFLVTGGLGILSALTRYGRHLPDSMVLHLLEVRTTLLPEIAQKACSSQPQALITCLSGSDHLEDSPKAYAGFDWELQTTMVKATGNPVFHMIFNDFSLLYKVLGQRYFQQKGARAASLSYYKNLARALKANNDVTPVVKQMMIQSQQIWQKIK